MTDINALIASAVPVQPPDDWFDNPGLSAPTAIKVLPNGRVYGHVASWDTDHIGMPFATRPPRNKSGYAYFKTGEIMTASGSLVPVGQLTLAGGHANLQATAAEAARHYDDTQSAVADVTVGEDQHGIWVSGAVRPDATPEKIRALRASAPSGDWRMINGRLEMVAVCQVNVPGFPIPRALAAGGARMSLVAAGTAPLLAQVLAEQEFAERLERLENLAEERESERLALVASAAKERVDRLRQEHLAQIAEAARRRVRDPQRHAQIATITAAAVRRAEVEALTAAASKLATGDYLMDSYGDVERAVQVYDRLDLHQKIGARQAIIAAAVEISALSALPEKWHGAGLAAAGNFKHLDKDFLSDKAEEQPRDSNGRFVQTGAFLRWKTPGKEGFQFGQVIGRKVNPDGTMDVRLADSKTVVKHKPNQVEVIQAILPADQVDNENDRGVPFKKKEGRKSSPSPSAPGSSVPSTDPAVVDEVSPDVDPGSTPVVKVGDRVSHVGDGTDLGTVTKSDDPDAIEVTDDGGLVETYDVRELVPMPGEVSATPAGTPAVV